MLRAPVFLRLRDDVDPKSVRRTEPRAVAHATARPVAEASARSADGEIDAVLRQLENKKPALTIAIGRHTLKLTHLERVYWPADAALKQPAITKRDLLRYFAQVSPFMLTHLADRPLTMIRMPEGIAGERFYQKHWDPELPPFARKITIFSEHKDERHDYLLCDNLATLLWLAQSGTLEFHVWHSRGKPGLHVFVPIERTLDFDAARNVSEMVGRHLVRLRPKDVTVEWSVPKRTGKIFMDYNMNVRGKTLNVAYSPRGAPGAPVSMPLTWEELAKAHPLDFRITNAAERLAQTGDRWRDAPTRKQNPEPALERPEAEKKRMSLKGIVD